VRHVLGQGALKEDEKTTLLLLAICAFASSASMRICDPLLPVLAVAFNSTLSAAAATTTGFALAYGSTQLFFGALGDRLGRLPVIIVAIAVAAAASAACALASSLDLLIYARMATGAFAAAAIPLSMAWIGDHVPFSERQPVLARYLIGQMLGMTGGQVGGGILADLVGWRSAFWAIAATFGAASLLLFRSVRREASAARTAGLAEQTAGAASARGGHEPRGAATQGFLQQTRVLVADRWALIVLGTVTLEGILLFGSVALVASYLQHAFGATPSVAGTVSALFGLGGLFYALNAKRLLVRLRGSGLCRMGGGLIALSMVVLLVQTTWQPAILAALMAGLGYYMLHNTLQTQATQLAPAARGAALAWFATGLWLGQGIGVTIAAAVTERFGFPAFFTATAIGLAILGFAFGRALDGHQARLKQGA
jgi:predicted MFS family arabinose efflux permease